MVFLPPLTIIAPELRGYDKEQARLMAEMCIVVDKDDKQIGADTKKSCHLMENINRGLLHRAFSVFLFDSQNRLLLQQRASEKITFPDMWTNTCCSHPLNTMSELIEEDQLGARTAAQRKLQHELGIQADQIPLDRFKFLTRIHYLAPSDGLWGEHEIDYIFFIKADVDVEQNSNEVRDIKYVTPGELRAMFEDPNIPMTPWFKLICKTFLFSWWERVDTIESEKDTKTIHRLGF
ncbi:isopentenyl-diphosphate delta-isomerase idi1 [Apophysomyces sp. BC1034]|nr:isopentenyl-diphosphate delta-isomerase idi1 [Apophysomyces sp. BC1015]KAG0176354.1 isopentenyl-diphosphate delta-isomerase idi1 [Apophysomyces sp. BC1021]KAG0186770.1 isopentenyl-diphosphate delta-isomerase idi1 [Apophysomyces sp. BC1034]